jgi:hypothetical protein
MGIALDTYKQVSPGTVSSFATVNFSIADPDNAVFIGVLKRSNNDDPITNSISSAKLDNNASYPFTRVGYILGWSDRLSYHAFYRMNCPIGTHNIYISWNVNTETHYMITVYKKVKSLKQVYLSERLCQTTHAYMHTNAVGDMLGALGFYASYTSVQSLSGVNGAGVLFNNQSNNAGRWCTHQIATSVNRQSGGYFPNSACASALFYTLEPKPSVGNNQAIFIMG